MAKVLKRFKNNFEEKIEQSVVLDAIEPIGTLPDIIVNNSPTLGDQSLKLLDQLEKAGFHAMATQLREMQIVEGVQALDPMAKRLSKIEAKIDELLDSEEVDSKELHKLLSVAVQSYQARAKAFLLPYGSVSPRSALQVNKARAPITNVNLAVGIGTGVSPRAK